MLLAEAPAGAVTAKLNQRMDGWQGWTGSFPNPDAQKSEQAPLILLGKEHGMERMSSGPPSWQGLELGMEAA